MFLQEEFLEEEFNTNTQKIFVFGENHFNNSVEKINKLIRDISPDIIYHEMIRDYSTNPKWKIKLSPSDIRKEYRKCRENNLCDPQINKDVFKLALELNCYLASIDEPYFHNDNRPPEVMHQEREKRMLEIFKNDIEDYKGIVCIVVGGGHIRSKPIEYFGGESVFYKYLKTVSNVEIINFTE